MTDAANTSERNICLTVAYDGTAYQGWQVQPNGPTVQAAVEDAVRRITGETVRVLSAGRTDSGVHALGQVANFRTRSRIPLERWRPALQHFLPPDIVVRHVCEVASEFHATHSAVGKRYRYVIHNSVVAVPFLRRYVWRYGTELDAAAMHAAAQVLRGTHDFRCFETQFPNRADSVRTITDIRVFRTPAWPIWLPRSVAEDGPRAAGDFSDVPDATNALRRGDTRAAFASVGSDQSDRSENSGQSASSNEPATIARGAEQLAQADAATDAAAGDFVCLEVEADGFLYNMVRAITGTLLRVGRGLWGADDVRRIVDSGFRSAAGETAPPQGLYLVAVRYPRELLNPVAGAD